MNASTTTTSAADPASERRMLWRPDRPDRRTATVALGAACLVVAVAGCSASLRHNYRSFQSALARGASCSELFDQRERFSGPETLSKVDDDLAEIGCTSRGATRNDG